MMDLSIQKRRAEKARKEESRMAKVKNEGGFIKKNLTPSIDITCLR
jgi:uncharacterized protein (UPF0218 family)